MILSICSDKGAPGVTTLVTALALVWPGNKVVVEADPSGADLPFRLRHNESGTWLNPDPSITSLAAVARLGTAATDLVEFAQPTTLGVPVTPGALTAERFMPLKALWPQLADALSAWPGTVICDLGRLQPGHPAVSIAKASTAVLLLSRADLGGLFHLRERVVELGHTVGDSSRQMSPVAVVLTGPQKTRGKALAETAALLESIGSPADVAGFIPEDRQGAQDLWAGVVTRRLAGSPMIRAVQQVAQHLLHTRPDLVTSTQHSSSAGTPVAVEAGSAPVEAVSTR